MVVNLCLVMLSFQAKPSLLMNGRFEKDLAGWKVEGDARVSGGKLVLGPGKAAVRQKYTVPGLRILFFEATLKPSAPDVTTRVRLQCFDRRDRQLMDLDAGPDPKSKSGIYMKTQAHTAYVILSIEKRSEGGKVEVSDATLADDDKDRVEHAPQVDLDAIMKPIWEGDAVLNESVLLLSQNGGPASGRLLFEPTKILFVKDASLGKSFEESRDYSLSGTLLSAKEGSSIPTMKDSELKTGEFPWTPLEGRHVFVTYTHADRWKGPTPEYQGERLPKTVAKLSAKRPLTIVAYGDSITLGINVSGFRNVPPFQPPWPALFARELGKRYDNPKVTLYNAGLGGMTADWAKSNAKDAVASLHPDLVTIAFGMNDFWSYSPTDFRKNIEAILSTIRQVNPNCEFILISSMKFDPAYTADPTYLGNFNGYAEELRKMVGPGIALLDMTKLTDALYQVKSQKDLATDPMHPDDFLSRWYAQGLVATLWKQP